jgi:DNA-directed RNA polymerase alpha subunit
MTWAANSIILQSRVGAVVVSVIFDDGANMGHVEENMTELINALKPICSKS